MPSFVCDHCQETLKKAKLDQHAQRCRQAAFSCIDCYKTFKGVEYREHSSCITEVQKYHTVKTKDGQVLSGNKNKNLTAVSAAVTASPGQKREAPVAEKKEAKKAKEEPKKMSEMDLIISKLSAKPKSLKDVLKSIKKSEESKQTRKSAKKLLEKGLVLSLDSTGKKIVFKLLE